MRVGEKDRRGADLCMDKQKENSDEWIWGHQHGGPVKRDFLESDHSVTAATSRTDSERWQAKTSDETNGPRNKRSKQL